jgi:hypothetical protein
MILGIVVGVIAGFLTIGVIEAVGHQLYPVATNVDFRDREAVKAFMASMPFGGLTFVVAAWIAGAYVAAVVGLVIGERKRIAGLVPSGLILLATVANLFMLPHPGWMGVVGLSGILLAMWLADALFARKT